MKIFIILDWACWSLLFIALVYALLMMVVKAGRRAEGRPALGIILLATGLLFSTATGMLLYWFTLKESFTGLLIMALVLAWPIFPLATQPLSRIVRRAPGTASAAGSLPAGRDTVARLSAH